MPAAGPKDRISVYNYIELGMTALMGIMIAAEGGSYYASTGQFVCAITYGFLIINIMVVMMIFLKEEIAQKHRLTIAGTGMCALLLVAIVIILEIIVWGEHITTVYLIRLIIAAAAAVVAGIFYVFDFILVLKGQAIA